MTAKPPVADLITGLAERLGVPVFVAVCTDLLGGAEREAYVEELRSLTGHAWQSGDAVFDRQVWQDHWVRTWGARGLLHVWDDSATTAVVSGLADEHWRPAEMCLKVTARHDVAGAGDAAAVLLGHDLPRVRAQALRALAVAGDTQHFDLVRERLEDEEESVRTQAARALERMGTRLDVEPDRPPGYRSQMRPSYPFDPDLHTPGSVAARGRCSWHGAEGVAEAGCAGEAVVSFQDAQGQWQSGCQRALEDLVDREEIEPLGQGA